MGRILVFLCYCLATLLLGGLILIGWCLTKLYKRYGWPEESDVGNCWSYAIPIWLRDPKNTHLLVSLSRYAPVPHVAFVENPDVWMKELKPVKPQYGFRGIFDSFWFQGRIREGKGEE